MQYRKLTYQRTVGGTTQPIVGAPVAVYVAGGTYTTLAPGVVDGSSSAVNPIYTDANGQVIIAAPDGTYDVQVTPSGAPALRFPNEVWADIAQESADAVAAAEYVESQMPAITAAAAAAQAALLNGAIFANTADALSLGVQSITLAAGGSGSTVNGTLPVTITNGTGSGASYSATLVGGVVISVTRLARGKGYTGSVTATVPGATGLTGLNLVPVTGVNAPDGNYFWVVSTDGASAALLWKNVAGVATAQLDSSGKQIGISAPGLLATLLDTTFTYRSGYLWGVVDAARRLAIAIDLAGDFVIPGIGKVKPLLQSLQTSVAASTAITTSLNASVGPIIAANDVTYSASSGYLWAVIDAVKRIAFGVDKTGALVIPGLGPVKPAIQTLQGYQYEWSTRSGWMWGVADSLGRLPMSLDLAGNLFLKGVKADVPALSATLATVKPFVIPNIDITGFGDSLTQEPGTGGTAYIAQLRTLMAGQGRVLTSKGIGGDTSTQIAFRMGAISMACTLAGNAIPASGPVTVTWVPQNGSVAPGDANMFQAGSYTGEILGVAGVMTQSGGSSGVLGTYTFTRSTAGAAIAIDPKDPQVNFNVVADTANHNIAIFWPGQNDPRSTAGNNIVLANLDAMVNRQRASDKRFVVMSVLGANAGSYPSGAGYLSLIALNNAIRDKYPRNYINVRGRLVASYDSAQSQDVTDYGNDIVPTSLRSDAVHLNTAGYGIVASELFRFITYKGW